MGKPNDGKFNIDEIYTPLSVAKDEVWKRWNDEGLKGRVLEFLGEEPPSIFRGQPKAFMARHLASPNNEFVRFVDLSKMMGLQPVCLEYLDDKFRAENEDKYYLGKLTFHGGVGRKLGERISTKKAIDFNCAEGACLRNIKTTWDENFIDFHHRLLADFLKDDAGVISDQSEWVYNNGKNPKLFYKKFLAFFICFGVLFEDYLENKNEKKFTKEIVLPSFKNINDKLGVKPLIVRMFPLENDNTLFARFYSESIRDFI